MQLAHADMRDEDEEDPKKPRSGSTRRKGDNAFEAQEHEPGERGPGGEEHDDRDHHMYMRC